MNRRIAFLFTVACFICLPAWAQVRVWQGTLTLPTYEEGAPDPNPPFDEFATNHFNYPYTIRDVLTGKRAEHNWRAIYLENEYLKCLVLPDIGGHLYSCTDKISGQPMFYANPSIKKANIGYRGAWAAFGIEFNFPVSHNWVSMSPVDFAFAQHGDGSASVTVSNIDRVYGMQWQVELILRPGSTVLEERVTLNNRSDARHRFYWWNNAGVQVWDDSQIQYPMRFAASHGFTEVQRWPMDSDGTDLSIIANQKNGPVSLFVHGSREPFMGVWNRQTNSGTVHFADYAALPGKKTWSWGVDADGLDWRKALSDNDSAYVEVQAGLFRNQETFAFLEPRQTIQFSEYWMPARAIGGISRANLSGVVHLARKGGTLEIGFNANRKIPGARLRLLDGSQVLLDEKADLQPEHIWSHEVALPDAQRKYTFELHDAEGAVLLRQTEGEYDWTPESEIKLGPQATYHAPEISQRSEDDWMQLGKNEELLGRILSAWETYRDGLAKFPNSFALRKSAGRLATALLRDDEAAKLLESVQREQTTDPEIAYYLGLDYDGLGKNREARLGYEAAYRFPGFRAAAALKLGELGAREGNFEDAGHYLQESLAASPEDLRSAEELVAIENALGKADSAKAMAEEWLQKYPASNFLQEELGRADAAHLAADAYRVINLASEYIRLGLYQKAETVLAREYPPVPADQSEPGMVAPQKNALLVYLRGYCRQKLGQSASADYAEASGLSTAYVFPSTATDQEAVRAALRANPNDATAHYLLGNWQFSKGLVDPALAEWQYALQLNAKQPVLHASMGQALLHEKGDTAGALAMFEQGADADPSNVANYVGMDQALSLLAKPAAKRVKALQRFPDLAGMPADLVYELALNRAEAGDYEGANALFQNRFFPRQEGGTNVRQVWFEIQLQHTLALAQSGHCAEALAAEEKLTSPATGLVFTEDGMAGLGASARANYLLAGMESACGQPQKARSRYERAARQTDAGQLVWARAAAKELGSFDASAWQPRVEEALTQAQANAKTSAYSGLWVYTAGALKWALGRKAEAEKDFRGALLLPDRMLAYHLSRLGLAGNLPD